MDLWIRNQSKMRLVNVKDVSVVEFEVRANWKDEDDYFRLGSYKSTSRAIEVLDEIQKLIMGADKIMVSPKYEQKIGLYNELVTIPKDEITIASLQTIVYEMPKE